MYIVNKYNVYNYSHYNIYIYMYIYINIYIYTKDFPKVFTISLYIPYSVYMCSSFIDFYYIHIYLIRIYHQNNLRI